MAEKKRTMEQLSKEVRNFLKGMTIKEIEYTQYLVDAWYNLQRVDEEWE